MADLKIIRDLMSYATHTSAVPAEYENTDYEAALRDQIRELAGTAKLFRRNKIDLFELLAESLDDVVPQKVAKVMGIFAETRFLAQGQKSAFIVKKGKTRARQFITRATESGVYETFRLDAKKFEVPVYTYGGAGEVDFERYLDGAENIMDVYEVIVDALVLKVFTEVQAALIASWNNTGRPAANKVYMTAFDIAAMQGLCNTVAAYGSPVIYCSPQFAAEMSNAVTYDTTTKIPDQDVLDVREQGYIGKFRGVPVIVMPQSYDDETNTKFTINPRFAYVIPTGGDALVRVAFEGEAIVDEVKGADNSIAVQAYKKFGVAVVSTPNYWGIAYNAAIPAGGWTNTGIS